MPATDALTAARRTFRSSERSVSMPASRRSRRIPTWATPSSMARCAGSSGKIACCPDGQSSPRTDGPRSTPARSWPITTGWPTRWSPSPRSRPVKIRSVTSRTSTASDGPGFAPASGLAAANAAPARNRRRPRARRRVPRVEDRSLPTAPPAPRTRTSGATAARRRFYQDPSGCEATPTGAPRPRAKSPGAAAGRSPGLDSFPGAQWVGTARRRRVGMTKRKLGPDTWRSATPRAARCSA